MTAPTHLDDDDDDLRVDQEQRRPRRAHFVDGFRVRPRAERARDVVDANDVRDVELEARHRYHNDPLTHARVELAARIVERSLGKAGREPALEAASVALVLVDLDKSSAEAKVARVAATCRVLLASPSPADHNAARLVLEALK